MRILYAQKPLERPTGATVRLMGIYGGAVTSPVSRVLESLQEALEKIYDEENIEAIYSASAGHATVKISDADLAFVFARNSVFNNEGQYFRFLRRSRAYNLPVIGVSKRRNFPKHNEGLVKRIGSSTVHQSRYDSNQQPLRTILEELSLV